MANNKRKDASNRILQKGETQRSNGTYEYRYSDSSGKRRSVYAPNLKELREKEAVVKQEVKIEKGRLQNPGSTSTYNDLYERFVEDRKYRVKLNTLLMYETKHHTWIAPVIGNMRLCDITKNDIEQITDNMCKSKSHSLDYCKAVIQLVSMVFNYAIDKEIVDFNPAQRVRSKIKISSSYLTMEEVDKAAKTKVLTVDQQRLFLDEIFRSTIFSKWYSIMYVILSTGMRTSEALGLRWSNVDFENRVIKIRTTLAYSRDIREGESSRHRMTTPKTRAGVRDIPMFAGVEQILRRLKDQYDRGEVPHSPVDGITDLVFVHPSGTPYSNRELNSALKRYVAWHRKYNPNVDMPDIHVHMLRHTFCTRLCEQGINVKAIQKIMGHGNIKMTLDVYAEATEKLTREEADKLPQDLFGIVYNDDHTAVILKMIG